MMKTMYGITVDTETGTVSKLTNDLCLASARAYCELIKYEKFEGDLLTVLVNEAVQGRLNVKDMLSVAIMVGLIRDAVANGYSYKDIVMLRSMYFDFREIVEFSAHKRSLDWVVKEYEIDEPEIEAVINMTADDLRNRYVSYKSAKEKLYFC